MWRTPRARPDDKSVSPLGDVVRTHDSARRRGQLSPPLRDRTPRLPRTASEPEALAQTTRAPAEGTGQHSQRLNKLLRDTRELVAAGAVAQRDGDPRAARRSHCIRLRGARHYARVDTAPAVDSATGGIAAAPPHGVTWTLTARTSSPPPPVPRSPATRCLHARTHAPSGCG